VEEKRIEGDVGGKEDRGRCGRKRG